MVRGGAYFRVADQSIPYRAHQEDHGAIVVTASSGVERALDDLRRRLSDAVPFAPVLELASRDRKVSGLLKEFEGLRPPLVPNPCEMVIRAICAQQVNLTWATTTCARLVEEYGLRHTILAEPVWEFPPAEVLAGVDPTELRGLQFTRRKAETIVALSQSAESGLLRGLGSLTNDDVIRRVTTVKGIGRWTADWLLARGLGRQDAVAAGDLGVRKAVSFHYLGLGELLDEAAVRLQAESWGQAANWVVHLLLERLAAGRRSG